MSKLLILLISLSLIFAAGVVLAQENDVPRPIEPTEEESDVEEEIILPAEEEIDVSEAISLDEDIQAEDLEVGDPNILPDSPFYFLKEWGRGIQSLFTFNPVAKAKLREKFANEKLIELKKMVEQKKSSERIEKGIENYQNEVEEAKRVTDRIRVRAEESVEVGKFLDKFIQHQTLHQRLLQKLEEQVPAEAFEKIKTARERHLEKFGEVMTKLEGREEQLQESLEKNLKEIKGGQFKEFKNLEVLRDLEEKVPEEATKEVIRRVQESFLIRLKEKLEQMSPKNQEKFKEYTEEISGVKENQIEILENLKGELRETPKLQEMLLQSREKIIEQVKERVQERETACPTIEKPAPNFCEKGRILIKKDNRGCIIEFKCVIPAEVEIAPKLIPGEPEAPKTACITLWDPVCGKDGKTYSNTCFVGVAGVEIDYKGVCREQIQLKKGQP